MTAIAEETSKEEKSEAARQPAVSIVSGIVDLGEGRGFLRTAGYRRSGGDIPITPAQVRQYGLRPGDHIEGTAGSRQAKPGEAKASQSRAGRANDHRRVSQRAAPSRGTEPPALRRPDPRLSQPAVPARGR